MDANKEQELIVLLRIIKDRLGWACLWLFFIMMAVCDMASKQGGK